MEILIDRDVLPEAAAEKPAHVAPGMQPSVPEGLCTPLSIPWLTKTAELLFLQGQGEPVASGRGSVVDGLTNEILIDVCDVISLLFKARSEEVKLSCGGLKEAEARGYLLADLLGVFELIFDDQAGAAGKLAQTRATEAKAAAKRAAKAARKATAATAADRDAAAAKARKEVYAAVQDLGLPMPVESVLISPLPPLPAASCPRPSSPKASALTGDSQSPTGLPTADPQSPAVSGAEDSVEEELSMWEQGFDAGCKAMIAQSCEMARVTEVELMTLEWKLGAAEHGLKASESRLQAALIERDSAREHAAMLDKKLNELLKILNTHKIHMMMYKDEQNRNRKPCTRNTATGISA